MADIPPQHKKVQDFLKRHPMGVLSTVTPDGAPWGSAIYYVTDEDFNFYFVTRAKTFKYQNLGNTPRAALTVADMASQTTVQASGVITKVPVDDYMEVVFNKLAKLKPKGNDHWVPPLSKIHEGNYMPLCLAPTKLHFADYSQSKPDPHADYIEKIIPTH
jgi:nitroimidazol reductase NimA-like FMN-containing flavoprotein (pyridoxamine 5'-phosphate oxidase superfamily)